MAVMNARALQVFDEAEVRSGLAAQTPFSAMMSAPAAPAAMADMLSAPATSSAQPTGFLGTLLWESFLHHSLLLCVFHAPICQ